MVRDNMTGVNSFSERMFFLFVFLNFCRNYVEPALLFVVWPVYQRPSSLPASSLSSECSGESLERGQPLHTAPTVSSSHCTQSCTSRKGGTANKEAWECAREYVCVFACVRVCSAAVQKPAGRKERVACFLAEM